MFIRAILYIISTLGLNTIKKSRILIKQQTQLITKKHLISIFSTALAAIFAANN